MINSLPTFAVEVVWKYVSYATGVVFQVPRHVVTQNDLERYIRGIGLAILHWEMLTFWGDNHPQHPRDLLVTNNDSQSIIVHTFGVRPTRWLWITLTHEGTWKYIREGPTPGTLLMLLHYNMLDSQWVWKKNLLIGVAQWCVPFQCVQWGVCRFFFSILCLLPVQETALGKAWC